MLRPAPGTVAMVRRHYHPGLQPGLPQRRSDHDPEVRPVGVWCRRLRLDRSQRTSCRLREAKPDRRRRVDRSRLQRTDPAGLCDTDVYEKNYGGHDTRVWGRVIFPLWLAPTMPTTTPGYYRKG